MTRALLRSDLRLAAPLVDIERGADGSLTLRSPEALAPHAQSRAAKAEANKHKDDDAPDGGQREDENQGVVAHQTLAATSA